MAICQPTLRLADKSFARWGDGHQYHIGDLSAATLTGYPVKKIQPEYRNWSQSLFRVTPTDRPVLKAPVYFWAKAWKPTNVSIWREFSPTRLTFLEYQLIGVASTLFPSDLLNEEGQNRALQPRSDSLTWSVGAKPSFMTSGLHSCVRPSFISTIRSLHKM